MVLTLEDLSEFIDVKKLLAEKPKIVIVATRCESCDQIHPFIFTDEFLYYAMNYISWHQYRTCKCGAEVSVYHGHGDFVYNPHNFVFKDEKENENTRSEKKNVKRTETNIYKRK